MIKAAKSKNPPKVQEQKQTKAKAVGAPEAESVVFELVTTTLTADEKQHLARLETVIHAKLADFFEVGSALLEIKSRELFRDTHSDFEDYCRERWEISRSYANKLIGSAERLHLLPEGLPKPANEFQMRPFLQLEPAAFPDKWRSVIDAAGESKVTSKFVSTTLNLPKKKRRQRRTPAAASNAGINELMDSLRSALKEKNVEEAMRNLAKLEKLLSSSTAR
jgi:hypothetical protein